MTMLFEELAARKTREAQFAHIEPLRTIFHRHGGLAWQRVGNAWTRARFDGDFDLFSPPDGQTALSLVFVQSLDGNTGASDPAVLGGGPTDQHLIYEGLSRVAADAVLAGAGSLHRESFFSVWHPHLVELRRTLGLPRHPAQIVISKSGRVDLDTVLFNVREVRVFLIGGAECFSTRADDLAARPWIRRVPLLEDDLPAVTDHLRAAEGIRRISVIGGRYTASRLIDAGLARDLYLTTTSRRAGEPGTPWYTGPFLPRLETLTRKEWMDGDLPIVFEHLVLPTTRGTAGTLP